MKYSFVSPRSNHRIAAILAFHKIGQPPANGWDSWFYISEATFADYLSFLHESDWQVIDLATFLRGIEAPDILPQRSVLLTFDDGIQSMRHVALPWLLRFGYPAVLFVPTDFIGGRNWFDAGDEPEEAMCDWEDLRSLECCQVSVQSHSASHRRFSELSMVQQLDELVRSKAVLEEGLSKSVTVFAYPYGDGGVDPDVQRSLLEQAGYRAACLYKGGTMHFPIANQYRLARVAMGPDTDLPAQLEQG